MGHPNNVTYATGSNPVVDEINDENNPSYLDQLGNLITDLFNKGQDVQELLNCPGGQRRGWKILDGNSPVEFAPCGCYDDALWPMILGIPAAAKAGASMASKMLVRKVRKKWTKKLIKESTSLLDFIIRDYYRALKGLNNGTAYLTRKMPPVKPGFKRLYRGQGARRLQNKINPNVDLDSPYIDDAIDNPVFDTPSGKYWTDDPGYADRFARTDGGLHTNNSQIFYVDIPIEDANKFKLGGGQRNGTVNDIKMLPGQKYGGEVGGVEWRDGEYWWPPHVKMPLRRRNSEGVIEIINDTPDPTRDIDLNPDVFAANEQSAGFEFYLDSSMYNTTYVDDVARETNLAKESTALAFQDLKDKTRKIIAKQKELEHLLDNPNIPDSELLKLVADIEDTGSNLNKSIDSLFNKYESDELDSLKDIAKQTADWISYFKYFIPWLVGLLAFIDQVMSLVSIVKDKSCIPLMEGGLSEFSYKAKLSDIRNQRIQAKASVWAELNPLTCECTECPGGWQFCDHSSITNLYLKETNSCIPPCCGEQEFKPITLTETCKCDCPEGKVFMPCESSDCTQTDSFLTSIFNPSKPGKCVDPNPNPEKLEWNSQTCAWECKDSIEIPPPPDSIWAINIKSPIKPPCKKDEVRVPPDCLCSGSYSTENLNINISTIAAIKLL